MPQLLPLYCLLAAVGCGWWRFRVVVSLADRLLPWFSFSQRVICALTAPVALIGDWTALSWAAFHFVSRQRVLASADIFNALTIEGLVILILALGYALARVSVQAVHLPSPWLDKLIAARNSTGLGALNE